MYSIVVAWSLLNADTHEWPPVPLDWFLLKNGVLPTLETSFLFGFPWISVGMCLIVVAWSLLDANMHEWPPVPLDWFLSYKSFWGILFIKSFKSKGYGARSTTTSLRGVPRHSRLYLILLKLFWRWNIPTTLNFELLREEEYILIFISWFSFAICLNILL